MEREPAIRLIDKTFNSNFTEENYQEFIINLLDGIKTEEAFKTPMVGQYVPESFRDHIKGYHRIGKYYDSNNQVIEVLWVNLKKETALDRARTMQRNFIAWYLNGGRGGQKRDCALVGFYNEDLPDWRFSYVKMDYSLIQKESGKFGAVKEFTPAKRFSFLVGEYEPNHTAQKRLLAILEKDRPNLEDIEEAFNIEKVSKEFFAKYKELFLKLVDSLTEIRKNDTFIEFEFTTKQVSEANFCKKLLGQIVFLYFLQKKGWLGVEKRSQWGTGNKKFLRNLFNRAIKEDKNFFNDYLEHLFYEALAVERDEDYYSPFDCKIPFLDGGLFEPINEYSWATTDIVLPNELFSNDKKTPEGDIGTGILDVFDRYNFTVKEDEPLEKEVAVDPEMLGKVFEELLEVQDRKSKGAFYTPREIVHYMCQESLINYLATELEGKVDKEDIDNLIRYGDVAIQNEATARAKEKKIKAGEQKTTTISYKLAPSIKEYAKEIDKALADIKICDPAIGSGAFPVGIMNEIIRARLTLLESDYLRTFKNTLEKEDFIAKMRYEYKREAIQNSIYGVDIDCGAIEIAKLRLWMSLIVDEDDITKIKPLPNLDYKIVCGNSLIGIEKNLFNAMHLKKLEELKPEYFYETRKREKKKLKKEIDSILEELTKGGGFDFEIHFSEVFHENGGFDIIIGNPPYLGFQGVDKKLKSYLNKHYVSASGKFDLFIVFIEKSYFLLKEKGFFTFICPTAFTKRGYGNNIRQFLLNKTFLIELIDFEHSQIFEKATNYTGIFSFKKTLLKNNFFKYSLGLNGNSIEIQQQSLNEEPWVFRDENIQKIIDKLTINTALLQDLVNISEGVVTGLNEFYLQKKLDIIFDKDLFVKCFRGKEIDKYYLKETSEVLFYPYIKEQMKTIPIPEAVFKESNPSFYNYLSSKENKERIFSREYFKKSNKKWFELWNPRSLDNFIPEKIITPELSERNRFMIAEKNTFYGDTVCGLTLKETSKLSLKYLLAILNSTLIEWFYKKTTVPKAGGFFIYKVMFLNKIPIKLLDRKKQDNFVEFVNKILELTSSEDYLSNQQKLLQVKQYEHHLNLMIFKLYELDYSDILIVNPEFSTTKEDYESFISPCNNIITV